MKRDEYIDMAALAALQAIITKTPPVQDRVPPSMSADEVVMSACRGAYTYAERMADMRDAFAAKRRNEESDDPRA